MCYYLSSATLTAFSFKSPRGIYLFFCTSCGVQLVQKTRPDSRRWRCGFLCRRRRGFHLHPQRPNSHRWDAATCNGGKSQRLCWWGWCSVSLPVPLSLPFCRSLYKRPHLSVPLSFFQRLWRGCARSTTPPSSRWSRPTSTTSWGSTRSQVPSPPLSAFRLLACMGWMLICSQTNIVCKAPTDLLLFLPFWSFFWTFISFKIRNLWSVMTRAVD